MIKGFVIKILLLFFVLPICVAGFSQNLRIDFERIDREDKTKKTNGEHLNYIRAEVQKIVQSLGKISKEYIYLQGYFLDEYNNIYEPASTLNPISIQEYSEGRKELVSLNQRVYGDTSIQYANAIVRYILNCTNLWNEALDTIQFGNLIDLSKKAINNFDKTTLLTDEIRYDYLCLSYSQLGDIFKKFNQKDSTIKYYNRVLEIKKEHPKFDIPFASFINKYASFIEIENQQKSIDFLLNYEQKISENYKSDTKSIFYFYSQLLHTCLLHGYADKKVVSYIAIADSVCKKQFGELSKEYVEFVLNYRLLVFKSFGWKSKVFQELAYLDKSIFSKNRKLLTQDESTFIKYNLEWYNYYKSVNNEMYAFKQLKWIELYDTDSSINRISFTSKITVYSELANYYTFTKFDSCLYYTFKVLDLEIQAKKKWGDYVIHQYAEIAKLFVNEGDTSVKNYFAITEDYCVKAAIEFKNAYGLNSSYYKSVMFTHAKLLLKMGLVEEATEQMYPYVYSQLYNNKFIPLFSSSVFQTYADILNKLNKSDSADFFYSRIYERNFAGEYFRILGGSTELQLKSLRDINIQGYQIFNEHLKRFKSYNYKYLSTELAEYLFKKNSILQMQVYSNSAIYDAIKKNDFDLVKRIEADKNYYDSLLNSNTSNNNLVDSAYNGYDLDKNWLLQSYLTKPKKEGDKSNLIADYTYSDIQKKLINNDCFIDIARFCEYDRVYGVSSYPIYALIIIDKNTTEKLEYTFIENGEELEKLVQSQEDYTEKISAILAPLLKRLKTYKNIYINPDGIFNILNLYSLKDDNDEYLIKSKTIHYINTLNIGATNNLQKNNLSIALFGNPVFENTLTIATRNIGEENNGFSNLSSLPYTKVEIETTADILAKKKWKALTFTELECSETKLKAATNSNILHIATHGYYFSENDTANLTYAMYKNSFLRSGLIMGKVNKNNQNKDDNILSAYEVMNLNLKNTSLVVLSACESAKGELKPGQGVYGLQRAFKIAGAENVLVSVKNVDDKATQLFMKYFYTNVAEGVNYVDALRNAQLEMLKHPLFNAPKFWNGFILVEK